MNARSSFLDKSNLRCPEVVAVRKRKCQRGSWMYESGLKAGASGVPRLENKCGGYPWLKVVKAARLMRPPR